MSIYHNAKYWDASGMDIYAIRKQNLLSLLAGKTQRSCADRWETSPSTLSQIVSKNPVRNLGDELARKIEQAEGLPSGWLDHVHKGDAASQSQDVAALTLAEKRARLEQELDPLVHSNVIPTQQPHRAAKEYPLISWVAAGSWQESCDNFQPGSADEWLLSNENAGPHGYWLEVKGNSMLPTFTPGMRILVRPEGFDLVSGKFYIAKLLDSGETTFKQYVRDAGAELLQPLNPAYPILPVTDNVRIIGYVVDAKLPPIF